MLTEMVDFIQKVEGKSKEGLAIMVKHNLAIDNLDEPMQKLTFTFYTMLVELSMEAEIIMKKLRDDG